MSEEDPINLFIGEQMRSIRNSKAVTQVELAEALNISAQQVQKYEIGKNRVSAASLFRIAMRLGVDPGSFFAGLPGLGSTPVAHSVDARLAFLSTSEGSRLVDDMLALPPHLRKRLALLLESIRRMDN